MEYEISAINNGQYSVSINLQSISDPSDITRMKIDLKDIIQNGPFIRDKNEDPIIRLNGNKLSYLSETIFPLNTDQNKQKVLLVFGNPATHSVRHEMFLFSKKNLNRHNMWKKLDDATLITNVNYSNLPKLSKLEKREKEAFEKKSMILNGETSSTFLLGLTTFYSFPTPVEENYRFSNVQGVLKFFGKIIYSINRLEYRRLSEYSFSQNAILVFVQSDSYYHFSALASQSKRQFFKHLIYWPAVSRARGAKNSGKDLLDMLESLKG